MYRISLLISEVYNQFLPLAESNGIRLNLDIVDPDIVTEELSSIKTDIEKTMASAVDRTSQGEITIQVTPEAIIVSDTGTTLSRPVCELLSNQYIDVKSRVGFGTKVSIKLKRDHQDC